MNDTIRFKTEDELLLEAESRKRDADSVNYLVGMLNANREPIIEVEVMTPDGLKPFNIGLLHYALELQIHNPALRQCSISAEAAMFSNLEMTVDNHALVKRHYTFDSTARTCRLVLTWAMLDKDGGTKDTPRYEVAYDSDKQVDNHSWKLVVNKSIQLVNNPGFHFLYHHNFVMIIDHEAGEGGIITVIPEGATQP